MSSHVHMPHAEHHESSGPEERIGRFRLELLIAILLGAAALIGALAAYAGHLSEGESLTSYNTAIRSSSDSNLFYNQGNQRLIQYQTIFQEYAKDAYQGTKTGDFTFPVYIQTTLMDQRLSKMVTWWTQGDNTKKYHSPFVSADPYYGIPEYAKGSQLDKQTTQRFQDGKKDQSRSDRYTLIEVLIASSLFLYGIASVTRGLSIKLGFLGVGFVLFVLSSIQLARVYYS